MEPPSLAALVTPSAPNVGTNPPAVVPSSGGKVGGSTGVSAARTCSDSSGEATVVSALSRQKSWITSICNWSEHEASVSIDLRRGSGKGLHRRGHVR